ncbi:MAG: hypothetical protein H3C47_03360 [Candidatus Cloacimonetes bacterium]|nr:hypothetical protein [Candidatus Cloacimonadota bacterium]
MMRFSFFVSLFCLVSPYASDLIQVRKAFEAKQYKAVIQIADKYPSLFREARESGWLARSLYEEKNYPQAAFQCHLVMEKIDFAWCTAMLRALKVKQEGAYLLGLARYQIHTLDNRSAMDSLSDITNRFSELALSAREELLPLFRKASAYHLMHEHLTAQKTDSPIILGFRKQMQDYQNTMSQLIRQKKLTFKDHDNSLYQWLSVSEQDIPEFSEPLMQKYREQLNEEGFSENIALRIGMLLLVQDKLEELAAYIESIKPNIGSSIPRHSLNHLIARLEYKQNLKKIKSSPAPVTIAKVREEYFAPSNTLSIANLPVSTSDNGGLNLTPIDQKPLFTARVDDFSPFHDLYQEFLKRMEKNPSNYEKRFLYRELDNAYDAVSDHEKAGPALDAYLATSEGQKFQAEADKMAQEFEKEDLINAEHFNGELNRFQKSISIAQSREEKLRVLSSFAGKWEKMVFDRDTNLFVQGAATAFRKTSEGKALAKMVYDLVTDLKILPADMDIPPDFLAERDWD